MFTVIIKMPQRVEIIIIDILARVLNSFIEKGGRKEKHLETLLIPWNCGIKLILQLREIKIKFQLMTCMLARDSISRHYHWCGGGHDSNKTLGSDIDEKTMRLLRGVTRAKGDWF